MKFIIGIGNPGKEYAGTRHNVGFDALDGIKSGSWKKESALWAMVARVDENTVLAKPQTFVNQTGRSVEALIKKHRLKLQDLLVVCDDVNLVLGKIRLRASGSAGGHHGLESVIETMGSSDFARLRIGVGSEKMPEDLTEFVLGRFTAVERKRVKIILERAAQVGEVWAKNNFEMAQKVLSQLQSKGE